GCRFGDAGVFHNGDRGISYLGGYVETSENNINVTAASESGTTGTYTLASNHSWGVGHQINITGMTPSGYNGIYSITAIPAPNQFSVTLAPGLGVVTGFGQVISANPFFVFDSDDGTVTTDQ